MPILKLDQHDENREIEFELRYLKSLTKNQRFLLMQKKSKEICVIGFFIFTNLRYILTK